MEFTYHAYKNLIASLKTNKYIVADYHDYQNYEKSVILRHDVDFSLEKALELAQCENQLDVKATYFLLLSTDFYNVASKRSIEIINEITRLGHEIGIHFDEQKYDSKNVSLVTCVEKEAKLLSDIVNSKVQCVSMHRPSQETLQADYKFHNLTNSYGREFFKQTKYVSDSRRMWHEDINFYINSGVYHKLHILTQPFWYYEREKSLSETLQEFVNMAKYERLSKLDENIRDLEDVMPLELVVGGSDMMKFDMRENKEYFVHESSYVDENTQIGKGTKIWHFSHIQSGCRIGEGCNIGQNVVVSPGVILGNNVKIQNNVSVYTGVICEEDVFLGPSCVFTNVINPRSHVNRKDEYRQTIIHKGASIGANATIVCGNDIGEYALIGAGTVITKEIPSYALVVGNPGKIMGWVCQCGEKLFFYNEEADCNVCGKQYKKSNQTVELAKNKGLD